MSVPNDQISPPDPGPEELDCIECGHEFHADELVDGVCPKCQPCPECEGVGGEECIGEVPKMPRAGIEIAIDNTAEAIAELSAPTSKHLIREALGLHIKPQVELFKDTIVGLATNVALSITRWKMLEIKNVKLRAALETIALGGATGRECREIAEKALGFGGDENA